MNNTIFLLLATLVVVISATVVTETTSQLHGSTTTQGTTTTTPCNCACEREAVLLHEIKELDFVNGYFTTSRRLTAIPQLECVGGSAKGSYEPNAVRCVNTGISAPHWRCEATLDKEVQLGSVTVACEGYTGHNDPYVLRGSCGLQYHLEYTHWSSYIWGKFMRIMSVLVFTPLKWLAFTALGLFAGLVVLALIRRPTRRTTRRQQGNGNANALPQHNNWPLTWLQRQQREEYDSQEDEDEEEEDEEIIEETETEVWTGRLRPRSKKGVPSPVNSDFQAEN